MKTTEKNWNEVGKRMPYTVPDDFFNQLEERVWQEVQTSLPNKPNKRRERRRRVRLVISYCAGIAAAVALLLTGWPGLTTQPSTSMEEVELAFCNLSHEDQEFLYTLYADEAMMEEMDIETEEILTIL